MMDWYEFWKVYSEILIVMLPGLLTGFAFGLLITVAMFRAVAYLEKRNLF